MLGNWVRQGFGEQDVCLSSSGLLSQQMYVDIAKIPAIFRTSSFTSHHIVIVILQGKLTP